MRHAGAQMHAQALQTPVPHLIRLCVLAERSFKRATLERSL
jgi:hypothetical protein